MVILRAKLVRNADTVIVCTTERSLDDGIVEIASRCGAQHFRGNLEDKLDRWLGATRQFNIDFFVTLDGDDLLCDPELMEAGIEQLKTTDVDFLEAPEGLICGSFTYGIRTSALEKVCTIKGTSDTEMMWVYFKDIGLFNVAALAVQDLIFFNPDIRMTLDYEEDLVFFQAIFQHYQCIKNDTPLRVIVPFLQEHPEIVQINAFRHQDWATNQKLKAKLILKDSGTS
jgi:spore coat polysaccharide biosynthesis protein SpsF